MDTKKITLVHVGSLVTILVCTSANKTDIDIYSPLCAN